MLPNLENKEENNQIFLTRANSARTKNYRNSNNYIPKAVFFQRNNSNNPSCFYKKHHIEKQNNKNGGDNNNLVLKYYNNNNNEFKKHQNKNNKYLDKNESNKKNTFCRRQNDWVCSKCYNLNFAFRIFCNRCSAPKELFLNVDNNY